MKIKARKQISVKAITKVDFPIGKNLTIETKNINFTIKEKDGKVILVLNKPYAVTRKKDNELIIDPMTIKAKRRQVEDKRLRNIRNFINWSEVSRLLVGNASTITKGHTPKRHTDNIEELLNAVNNWAAKQK